MKWETEKEEAKEIQFTTTTTTNANTVTPVAIRLELGPGVTHNPGAVDDEPGSGVNFHTRPLYNLAQTRQVEVAGAGTFSFAMAFETGAADSDLDGMPDCTKTSSPSWIATMNWTPVATRIWTASPIMASTSPAPCASA